ncbi:MAG TPA: hypothetical protein IAA57_00755 [Candidatus Pullilachnospira intestinigallinarum]|nr:hypothetical protein [Candidatus Pullilachnospira intestinigallinarum]
MFGFIRCGVSLGACHKNISMQLEQGVPVQGNELAIINLYLTSCVQYIALAASMAFCSFAVRKLSAVKNEMPDHATQYMLDPPADLQGSVSAEEDETEEDDVDLEVWGFKEQGK